MDSHCADTEMEAKGCSPPHPPALTLRNVLVSVNQHFITLLKEKLKRGILVSLVYQKYYTISDKEKRRQ